MARTIKIVLSWLLVLAVPVVSLGISCNALIRMPDIYQYKLNETKLLSGFSAGGQEEKVAETVASYMQHRLPELQYQYDEEDDMSLLFSRDEQNTMGELRKVADIFVGIVVIFLALGFIGVVILLKGEHQELVRSRLKTSWMVYVVMAIAQACVCYSSSTWDSVMGKMLSQLSEGQLIYGIYESGFWHMYCTWSLILGTAFVGIISYIIWKNSKPKSIFW